MDQDSREDHAQDDTMKAMQSELQVKGILMSKAWADLFGLFTKYQGELIKREHQLAAAQKEIIAKERQFKSHDEKYFKDSDIAVIQSESDNKSHQITNLETDLRLKEDLLQKAKAEIMMKDEQLFKAQVDLKRLQYDMATKQEQLLAKDRLISRMQDEMAKESAELMVQIYQLREAVKEEKMSHERTRATSENFVKNLQNAKQSESRYEPPSRDSETPSENTSSSNSGGQVEERIEEKEQRKTSIPDFSEAGIGRVPKIRHFMARDRHSPQRHEVSSSHVDRQQQQHQQQQQQHMQEHVAAQVTNRVGVNTSVAGDGELKPDVYTIQRQWRQGETKVGLDLSLTQKIIPSSHACVEKDHQRMGLTWTTCNNSNVVENIIQSFNIAEPDKMVNATVGLNNNYAATEVHYAGGGVERQPVFPGHIQQVPRPSVEIIEAVPRSKSESSSNQDESLQTSSSNQDGTSPPVCVPCKKVFFNEISYRKHLKNSHDRRFKCDECGKSFGTRIYLQIHLRTHTGEKPYKCKECKKRFSVQSSLLRHIRIHTGEKPYKCEQCGWAFAVRSNLIQHIRTHSGERPYQCQYCMVRFTRQNSLQKHIVMTHAKETAEAKAQ